jgi:hypothetical protein
MALIALLPDGDMLALLGCIALTAATLIFVFLTEPDAVDFAEHRSKLDQLMERRDTIYDNLRDLKFEYRAGKFAEQDYEQMHQSLENEAAVVLAEIEIAAGNQGTLRRRDADVRRAAPTGAAAKAGR